MRRRERRRCGAGPRSPAASRCLDRTAAPAHSGELQLEELTPFVAGSPACPQDILKTSPERPRTSPKLPQDVHTSPETSRARLPDAAQLEEVGSTPAVMGSWLGVTADSDCACVGLDRGWSAPRSVCVRLDRSHVARQEPYPLSDRSLVLGGSVLILAHVIPLLHL